MNWEVITPWGQPSYNDPPLHPWEEKPFAQVVYEMNCLRNKFPGYREFMLKLTWASEGSSILYWYELWGTTHHEMQQMRQSMS